MSLIISSNSGKTFPIVSEGQHMAILGVIVDLGTVETTWGEKERLRLVWVTDDDDEGNPLLVFQTVTKSLHEKSALAKLIKTLTGKIPDASYDVTQLLGTRAMVVVEHRDYESKTFAGVTAVLRASKDSAFSLPDGWTAPKFKSGTVYSMKDAETYDASDSNVPF